MFNQEFFFILKNILLSPYVLGCLIVCMLFLKLVFYILYYEKKNDTFSGKKQKKHQSKKSKTDTVSENTDTRESDEMI